MWRTTRDETFEAFFRLLFRRAVGVADRILGNTSAAEDAAAEAMARAYADWKRIAELPYRDAWVLRVTANVALDMARKRRPTLEPGRSPDHADRVTDSVTLARELEALPRRQREIVALRHLAGFSESEVARALGLAPGTVKAHGHRAMTRLRDRLGDVVAEGSVP